MSTLPHHHAERIEQRLPNLRRRRLQIASGQDGGARLHDPRPGDVRFRLDTTADAGRPESKRERLPEGQVRALRRRADALQAAHD